MLKKEYDTKPGSLVLTAELVSGFVGPEVLTNRVGPTRIYGDGKVVFINPLVGSAVIHEGHLHGKKITQLFALLKAKGFWRFQKLYFNLDATDMPTYVITATRRGAAQKWVGCFGGELSAPPGFMECYHALLYPQIQPSDVRTYRRQPISAQELEAGFYFGFEYQKKLDTPRDWVWIEAGPSSRWSQPPAQTRECSASQAP